MYVLDAMDLAIEGFYLHANVEFEEFANYQSTFLIYWQGIISIFFIVMKNVFLYRS
jgi:hypothetical protein